MISKLMEYKKSKGHNKVGRCRYCGKRAVWDGNKYLKCCAEHREKDKNRRFRNTHKQ